MYVFRIVRWANLWSRTMCMCSKTSKIKFHEDSCRKPEPITQMLIKYQEIRLAGVICLLIYLFERIVQKSLWRQFLTLPEMEHLAKKATRDGKLSKDFNNACLIVDIQGHIAFIDSIPFGLDDGNVSSCFFFLKLMLI